MLVKIRHERIVGNRKPFTIRAPLTIEFDVRGLAVDVTVLRDGLPFAFINECGGCGFHIEVPGEFAVFLEDRQAPSLVFTVIG
ncbi:MAG TPA: hypothetical protein VFM54_23600 [Micromonosporaceae bacterium]|nr:hypothetical protein [Micromonosporaceae bacterium]